MSTIHLSKDGIRYTNNYDPDCEEFVSKLVDSLIPHLRCEVVVHDGFTFEEGSGVGIGMGPGTGSGFGFGRIYHHQWLGLLWRGNDQRSKQSNNQVLHFLKE